MVWVHWFLQRAGYFAGALSLLYPDDTLLSGVPIYILINAPRGASLHETRSLL